MERSELDKYAKTLAYRRGDLLQIGAGDGAMIKELRKHYTKFGVCEKDYIIIKELKEIGIVSDDMFTYYNNSWKEMTEKEYRYETIYLDISLLSQLTEVLKDVKNLLTPGGMFTYYYSKSNEDSNINRLCEELKLTINWIPIQGILIPFISYKEAPKSKWVSVIKK